MQIKDRDRSLDVLRGIAITFVIFGHITHIPELRTYIWGFHIPLFFFISGILFEPSKYQNPHELLKSRIKGLVIPYIIFYILTFIYWVAIEKHTRGADLTITSQLVGLLYGTYSNKYMFFNGALWFLPALFSMEMLYWLLCKIGKISIVGIAMILMNAVGIAMNDWIGWLPWGINAAMIGCVFFWFGNVMKIDKLRFGGGNFLIVCGITGISLQYILMPVTGSDLAALHFSHPLWYIPVALVGIMTYWSWAKVIKANLALEWLGRNSLVLFAFQEPVYNDTLIQYLTHYKSIT